MDVESASVHDDTRATRTTLPASHGNPRCCTRWLDWLDCTGLGLSHDEVVSLFRDKAGLAMNEGSMFGEAGKCHMRFNMGSPRCVLEQAMHQLEAAVKGEGLQV